MHGSGVQAPGQEDIYSQTLMQAHDISDNTPTLYAQPKPIQLAYVQRLQEYTCSVIAIRTYIFTLHLYILQYRDDLATS